ncbi:protein kinase [Conexibacter sp. W3-3-2]|uniref:serine/threonine protein kinase n=1 Tax=Conexibacter sp. W3-3-2 TaxID=2675227 RepID=UPI0012B9E3C4|nr:protein kinase [Conexibacter sp. W3-3-2]MTD44828.1 protein kinase [Conexibacter sp. W3-3-2]
MTLQDTLPEIDGYVVERVVSRGAGSTVLRARHTALGRRVTIRLHLLAEGAQDDDLLRVVRGIAGIEHPGLTPVLDAGYLPGGRFYVVTAAVDAVPLADSAGTLTVGGLGRVLLDVARGLEAAHAVGIVHGEVRPASILVHRRGDGLLADLGDSRLSGATRVADDTLLERMRHLAPEAIAGRAEPRSDVFGLGGLALLALADQAPYEGADHGAVVVRRSAPVVIPELDAPWWPGAERVLARALALDPQERWPSPTAFVEAFLAATTDGSSTRVPLGRTVAHLPEIGSVTRIDRVLVASPEAQDATPTTTWRRIARAGLITACGTAVVAIGLAGGRLLAPEPRPVAEIDGIAVPALLDAAPATFAGARAAITGRPEGAVPGTSTGLAVFPSGPPPDPLNRETLEGLGIDPTDTATVVAAGGTEILRYTAADGVVLARPARARTLVARCASASQAICARTITTAALDGAVPPRLPTALVRGIQTVFEDLGEQRSEPVGGLQARRLEERIQGGRDLAETYRAARNALAELGPIAAVATDGVQRRLSSAATRWDRYSVALRQRAPTRRLRREALRADADLRESVRRLRRLGFRVGR